MLGVDAVPVALDFDADPHPALHTSMEIDLRDLHVHYRNYDRDDNLPVLHQKDLLVISGYPLYEKFAKKLASQLLRLYQPSLQPGEIEADNSAEQMQLRLTRLVVEKQGKLRVYNKIYASVFDLSWAPDVAGFGYIMPLREPRYKGMVDLMKRRIEPNLRALATAGFALADSFFQLHAKGLCYRDISFVSGYQNNALTLVQVCFHFHPPQKAMDAIYS